MEITVAIVFALYLLGIGTWGYFKSKNNNNFYLAGRKQNTFRVTASLLATILGGSATIGTINYASKIGWGSSWFMILAALGLFILIPFVEKIRKFDSFTMPNIILHLFGEKAHKFASILIPIAWLGIVTAQIVASAKILESFFNLDYHIGVIISGLIFVVYTIAGGQISIFKTDQVQLFFILGGLLIVFGAIIGLGHLPKTELTFPFNQAFKQLDLLVLIFTYGTTFFIGPDIYSRLFCAKDNSTAQHSLWLTAIILIPIGFIIGAIGVTASTHLGHIGEQAIIIDYALEILPKWGVAILVLGLLSAVLSSADTTLLSSSMILTELLNKDLNQQKSIQTSRIIILIIGFVSIAFALLFNSIISILLISFTIFTGAFFVPIAVEFSGANYSKKHLLTAMLAGGSIAGIGKIINLFIDAKFGNIIILISFAVSFVLLSLKKSE